MQILQVTSKFSLDLNLKNCLHSLILWVSSSKKHSITEIDKNPNFYFLRTSIMGFSLECISPYFPLLNNYKIRIKRHLQVEITPSRAMPKLDVRTSRTRCARSPTLLYKVLCRFVNLGYFTSSCFSLVKELVNFSSFNFLFNIPNLHVVPYLIVGDQSRLFCSDFIIAEYKYISISILNIYIHTRTLIYFVPDYPKGQVRPGTRN